MAEAGPSEQATPRGPVSRRLRPRGPWWPIGVVGFGALVFRLLHVLVWWPACDYDESQWAAGEMPVQDLVDTAVSAGGSCYSVAADSVFYYAQGKMIAAGDGFGQPYQWLLFGEYFPSAAHPPAYPMFLALNNLVGLTSVTEQRVAGAVVGAIGVVLIGLVARRLVSVRAGVVAALLAAVYPMLWINDTWLLSEVLLPPALALILLAAYRFWERPRPSTAAILGLTIGLGQLVRSETGVLAFLLIGWLAFTMRSRLSRSSCATLALLGILVTQLVMTPWTIRNLTSFANPVLGTSGVGTVLLSGSCDEAFYDPEHLGLLNFACLEGRPTELIIEGASPDTAGLDESEYDAIFREMALEYLTDNISRVPVVVAARVGRMWEVYRPLHNVEINGALEGRGRAKTQVGLAMYYVLLPVAGWGLVQLRRRGIPISPFVCLAIVVTVTAAGAFALHRYRLPVEVGLVILAGVGLDDLMRRASARWRSREESTQVPV